MGGSTGRSQRPRKSGLGTLGPDRAPSMVTLGVGCWCSILGVLGVGCRWSRLGYLGRGGLMSVLRVLGMLARGSVLRTGCREDR